MEHTGKTEKKRRGAFTLAEFLVVVAITMILAGVSFVAVIRYQSRLKRLEMDQTAKEIFLAAQNQLSLDTPEGVLKRILSQEPDSEDKLGIRCEGEDRQGIYVVLYQPQGSNSTEEIRNRLLPFGAVDETVRTDGSYLIYYEPAAGTVREVWYSDRYVFTEDDIESTALTEAAADAGKREHFTGANPEFADQNLAVGYYAGDSMTEPDIKPADKPKTADLELFNDDILYAKITIPNMFSGNIGDVKLYLEGVSSGAKGCMDVKNTRSSRVQEIMTDNAYYVILDDVTTDGMQFYNLNKDGAFQIGGTQLVPGEDIRMWLEISSGQGAVPFVSQVRQENSIFQSKKSDKVTIASMRHLENLDYRISGFHPVADKRTLELSEKEDVNGNPAFEASQQKHLDWPSFRGSVATLHNLFSKGTVNGDRITVCYSKTQGDREVTAVTADGCYAPVQPQFPLIYSGNAFNVTGLLVRTNSGEDGGMFGTVTYDLSVRNLELKQANITSERNAGALIGMGDGSGNAEGLKIQVENVKIRYPQVLAKGPQNVADLGKNDAGAVIGTFAGEQLTIRGVMAANTYRETMTGAEDDAEKSNLSQEQEALYRIQSVNGIAGGLVGMSSGSVNLTGSMASLYVDAGSYAGGLTGIVQAPQGVAANPNVTIESCYVGGHTVNKEFQTDLLPGQANFDQAVGRYNIVSRSQNAKAGGLAAILPAGSQIAHSYVTASVYASGYGEVENEDDSASTGSGSGTGNDNITDTGDENGTAGDQTETEVPDDRKQAAFVAFYGSLNEENAEGIPGAAASDSRFRYCYSAVKVNGTRVVEYPESLKADFEPKPEFALQAFPYDKTLGSGKAYPMPTTFQLVKKDPAGNGAQKALPAIACVHIGDWLVPVEKVTPKPQKNGLEVKNENRLWADYVMDMPEENGIKFLSFSIYGTTSQNTVYYLIALDIQDGKLIGAKYYLDTNAGTVQSLANAASVMGDGRWMDIYDPNKNAARRIEIEELESGQLKVRLYLDNKAFVRAAGKYLYWSDIMVAGEDFFVRASEKHIIPDDTDPGDTKNSYFKELVYDKKTQTYTAKIANARHLINLSFYDTWRFNITNAEQTDNILWQEDPEITANTTAYCKDLGDAYPGMDVIIFDGTGAGGGYTQDRSFKPIENTQLYCYDGKGFTISKLKISPQQSGDKYSALFAQNAHLTVKDLTIKDPEVSGQGTAAVLLGYAGNNNYIESGSSLTLSNIRIYGDMTHVQVVPSGYGYVGGAVAYAGVESLTLDHVSVYGKDFLIDSSKDLNGLSAGGLIGYVKVRKKLEIDQSMFSGYLDGQIYQNGAGGLIGKLETENGPNLEKAEIKNCYVAGRNASCGQAGAAGILSDGISIAGNAQLGGLIGYASGPLSISNTFSTAGLYHYSGTGGTIGGLIGQYAGDSTLNLENCYYAGNTSKFGAAGSWGRNTGILIGMAQASQVTWNQCAYLKKAENEAIIGSAGITSDEQVQEDYLKPNATESSDSTATYVYDEKLKNSRYPYKLWTTEPDESGNLRKTYRGDWIVQ